MSSDENGDPTGEILNVLSDQVEGLITGFVVVAEYMDTDGEVGIWCDTYRGQRAHRSLGLLEFAQTVERRRIEQVWEEDE